MSEERQPPKFVEETLERVILGVCVSSLDEAHHVVYDALHPEDFGLESHRVIYRAVQAIHDRDQSPDVATVVDELRRTGKFKTAGGGAYVAQCCSSTVTTLHLDRHIDRVRQLSKLRRVRTAMRTALLKTQKEEPAEIDAWCDEHVAAITRAAEDTSAHDDSMSAAVASTLTQRRKSYTDRKQGRTAAVACSLPKLQAKLSGWHAGDLVVIAARPGMGKTSLAMQEIVNTAKAGHHVGIMSLEMPREELVARQLAGITGVSVTDQRSGDFSEHALGAMLDAGGSLGQLPIQIDDRSGQTVDAIIRRVRVWHKRYGVAVVAIDHLTHIALSAETRGWSRSARVGEVAKRLKALARELGICVMLLCQLNRNLEHRQDKRPTLADLRESGEIEEAADAVLMLYRAAYYDKSIPDSDSHTEIRIAKHRHGETGIVNALFDRKATTFVETSARPEPPPHHHRGRPHWTETDADEDLPL